MSEAPVPWRLRFKRARRRANFVGLLRLLRWAGFERARALGQIIGDLQFYGTPLQRLRLQNDLAKLLGRSASEVGPLLQEAYRVNTAAVLELMVMFDQRLDDELLGAQLEVEGLEHLQAAMAGGRGAILLATHAGNAGLVPIRLAAAGWPVSVVYREARMMDAGFIDAGLTRYGIQGILANTGIKAYAQMLSALKQGRIVFVMMDQGVKRAEDGLTHRFLGKDLPMTGGVAQLARHARAPVLPMATLAAEPRWQFVIAPPLVTEPGSTLDADTERLVRLTESQILAHPQLWSWPHRRWARAPLAPDLSP